MRNIRFPHLLSCGLCLLLLAACATTKPQYARPFDYIAPMEKLTSAVDAQLHNPYSTNLLSDGQLLAAAMRGKPELQQAFHNVTLLSTNNARNAIILMVSPTNDNVAWLEDATWTPQVDKFHFQSNPPSPAQFTIKLP